MPTKKEKQPLSVTHPELAKEADGWDPALVTAGSNKKMLWECKQGHKWEALISNRSRGRGCGKCAVEINAKKKLGVKFTSNQLLVETHPEIANEIVDIGKVKLRKLRTHSNTKLVWRCKNGHEYPNTPNNRSAGQGCPYCSGRKVLKGYNDLQTTHSELASQAFGWDPTTISFGMSKKLEWKCKEGHIWSAIINLRTSQETDCPFCTGKKVLIGFNDLATTHPEIAKEAYGWDPRRVTYGSTKNALWKCANGHKWTAVVSARTPSVKWTPSKKTPKDEGGKIENEEVSRLDNLISNIATFKSRKIETQDAPPMLNPEVRQEAQVSISSMGSGCPSCSQSGFDPNKDGWLYFLQHPSWEMLQVGISNFPENRLNQHLKSGWELVELRGPMDGHLAQQWETGILRMLKAKGADLSNAKIAGKFDGYSEAWSKSTFEIKSIKELMRLTDEFEEK